MSESSHIQTPAIQQRYRLANTIQEAIENEASRWGTAGEFYHPSPGQTWSHVAHRITRVVMDLLDGGLSLRPIDEPCDHRYWNFGPNGTTYCRICGADTTHMEMMGG